MTPRLRRLGWGFVDQAMVSVTGAVVTVQGAATLPPADFGRLSAALAIYYFVFTGIRAVVSEVYLVRFAGSPDRVPPGVARWAQATTVRLALTASVAILVVAAVAPLSAPSRQILVGLAVALPLLLWQEARRSVLLAAARPARSAASSGLALLGVVAGGTVLGATVGVSGGALLLCWAAGAALAVGCVPAAERQARVSGVQPTADRRGGGSWLWLVDGRAYWPRFLCQDMAQGGASQLAVLLVAAAAGTVVVAGLRAAMLLLSPLLVLHQAAVYFALAEATRVRPAARRRFLLLCQAGAILAGLAWLVVLDLLPDAALELVIGENLAAGLSALPGMALFAIAASLLAAPVAVLRSSGQVQAGMALGLAFMPVLIGLPTLIAAGGGSASDVAGGFGAVGLLSAAVWTLTCLRILPTEAAPARHRGEYADLDPAGPLTGERGGT